MAQLNCSACDELREYAPNFVVNGIGETECTSLQNDTGLAPSTDYNDCNDLNNMNDCLIGNMKDEMNAYEVCDWKPFTKSLIGNVWSVVKGIVCSICGIWTNIHDLQEYSGYLCTLINTTIAPSASNYGIFPRNTIIQPTARTMGSIPNINGRPALIDYHSTSHNADIYTGVGIRWGTVDTVNCTTGAKVTRCYWMPYVWGHQLNKDVSIGDALWVVTKSQLQANIQWSDALWQVYTDESWTWVTHRIISGADAHKTVWLKLHVGDAGYSNDYLVLTYQGTSYPNTVPNYDAPIMYGGDEFRWGYVN